jgi:two-component system sensor histidine kinase YesM
VLERLNGSLPLPQTGTSRLGIMNVVQRLNLRYNGEAVVEFGNRGEEGEATVRIRLPLGEEAEIYREEGENHV